jgi:hypothetical protein
VGELNLNKTPRALYSIVNNDKGGAHALLGIQKKINQRIFPDLKVTENNECHETKETHFTPETCSSSSENNNSNSETEANPSKTKKTETKKSFKIAVEASDWQENYEPIQVLWSDKNKKSGHRVSWTLKQSTWTSAFHSCLDKQQSLNCNWSFKTARISPTGQHYCTIKAYCVECNAELIALINNKPENNKQVLFDCTVINHNPTLHKNSTRNLSGPLRQNIGALLHFSGLPPSVALRNFAAQNINFGDRPPRTLPSTKAMRNAKYSYRKQCFPTSANSVLVSLLEMKYSSDNCGIIKDIGLDGFFIYYWSVEQTTIYNEYSKNNITTLIFDATGSVVKKIEIPGKTALGHSGNIFLYTGILLMNNPNKSVPVIQMLSERHNTTAITSWLRTWLSDGAKIPNEVICDFSLALLNAVSCSFAGMYLQDYTLSCYEYLINKRTQLPVVFIRVDFAHFIHAVCKWKSLRGKTKRVRELFIRGIAQAAVARSISEIEKIFIALLVAVKNETDGVSRKTGQKTVSSKHTDWLKSLTGGLVDIDLDDYIDEEKLSSNKINENEYDLTLDELNADDDIISWINRIFEKVNNMIDNSGDHDSAYFCTAIVSDIKRIMKSFPLWSAVMVDAFGYGTTTASSAAIEAYFRVVKRLIFHNYTLPIRADIFIMIHIMSLRGQLVLEAAERNDLDFSIKPTEQKLELLSSKQNNSLREKIILLSLKYHENWRNKGVVKQDVDVADDNKIDDINKDDKKIDLENITSSRQDNRLENNDIINETLVMMNRECISNVTCPSISIAQMKHKLVDALNSPKKSTNVSVKSSQVNQKVTVPYTLPVSRDIPLHEPKIEIIAPELHIRKSTRVRKPKYLSKCPEILYADEEHTGVAAALGLLKNGGEVKTQINGKIYILRLTCAFDSLIQALAAAYCDSRSFKNFLDNVDPLPVINLIKQLVNAVNSNAYKLRANILADIFSERLLRSSVNENIYTIDCVCNVETIIDKSFHFIFSLKVFEKCSNRSCNNERCEGLHFTPANINILLNEGMAELQTAIDSSVSSIENKARHCCNSPMVTSVEPTRMQIVQADIYQENAYFSLHEVPITISIKGKQFLLRSVVAYQASSIYTTSKDAVKTRGNGHYVSYAKRIDGTWQLFDDLRSKVERVSSSTNVHPHLIIYTL